MSNILAEVPKSKYLADVLEVDTGRGAITRGFATPRPRSSIMADGAGESAMSKHIADCADGDDLEHGRDVGPSCVFFTGATTGGNAPTGDAGRERLDKFAIDDGTRRAPKREPPSASPASNKSSLGVAKLDGGVGGLADCPGGWASAWLDNVTSAAAPRARRNSGGPATTATAPNRRIGLLDVLAQMGFAGRGVLATC